MNTTVILNRRIRIPTLPPHPGRRPRRPTRDRAYRQALRAAELAAWNAADPRAITRIATPARTGSFGESLVYLVLGAAILATLFLGTVELSSWPANAESLKALVGSLIP